MLGIALPDEPAAERLHAVVVPDLDVMRERRIVNFREIIRFDIEGLSLDAAASQARAELRRLAGGPAAHDDAQAEAPRDRAPLPGDAAARAEQPRRSAPSGATPTQVWAADPHVARVLAAIRGAAPHGSAVRPDANLELDLGLDSMERVELLSTLELEFGVDVPDEAAQRIFTVRDLVEPRARPPPEPPRRRPPARSVGARPAADESTTRCWRPILRPKPLFAPFAFASMRAREPGARGC